MPAADTAPTAAGETPLVVVDRLTTGFDVGGRFVPAVDDLTFEIARGETLGLVGESGSGKSLTALSILRLVEPPGRIAGGRVLFGGRDLLALPEHEIRRVRGAQIALIFQEPMTALNPVFTIGDQIAETLVVHGLASWSEARRRAVDLLADVRLPDPEQRARDFPHQLSGGMRQRALIATALACRPALVIADEPTTALDVTIQAQIVELVKRLRDKIGMAIIWITHDLGVISGLADTIQVMYAGYIVERGPVSEIFRDTRHPYTLGLRQSLPRIDRRGERLIPIEGAPPDMRKKPVGCPFVPRCPYKIDICSVEMPPLIPVEGGASEHIAACHVDVRKGVPERG